MAEFSNTAPPPLFALVQCVLGVLPVVNVRQQHAPANYLAACLAKRKAVVLKPAIDTVRPSESLLNLVWSA